MEKIEQALLEGSVCRTPESRLSCQILATYIPVRYEKYALRPRTEMSAADLGTAISLRCLPFARLMRPESRKRKRLRSSMTIDRATIGNSIALVDQVAALCERRLYCRETHCHSVAGTRTSILRTFLAQCVAGVAVAPMGMAPPDGRVQLANEAGKTEPHELFSWTMNRSVRRRRRDDGKIGELEGVSWRPLCDLVEKTRQPAGLQHHLSEPGARRSPPTKKN